MKEVIRWEIFSCSEVIGDEHDVVNKFASDGWEPYAVTQTTGIMGSFTTHYLRRQLPPKEAIRLKKI